MEITRNVILDLLPLYLADEASSDTRALIERYLESDPELAQIAKKLAGMEKRPEIPIVRSEDANLRTFRKARHTIFWTIAVVSGIVSIILIIAILVLFLTPA